jgi:hypothetical protein
MHIHREIFEDTKSVAWSTIFWEISTHDKTKKNQNKLPYFIDR